MSEARSAVTSDRERQPLRIRSLYSTIGRSPTVRHSDWRTRRRRPHPKEDPTTEAQRSRRKDQKKLSVNKVRTRNSRQRKQQYISLWSLYY